MHCSVELETAIGPSCPLVEMACVQGGGFVSRFESGIFEQPYLKRDGMWTLQRSIYGPVRAIEPFRRALAHKRQLHFGVIAAPLAMW